MRGIIAVFAVLVYLAPQQIAAARSIQSDPRYAAIVVDVNTGRILYSRSADRLRYPASLTKIMTIYMIFEALRDGKITKKTRMKVSSHAAGQAPSKLGLRPGQTISVDAAIRALVTKSANDVAAVVAEHLGGTESAFARQMTARSRALGMSNTTFRNASGLPNRSQKTTARDMARLGEAIIRDFPKLYKYFSTRSFSYRGRRYGNHNRLLGKYRGVDGIKTGYTRASGFNLTASVRADNRHVIAVVMGGPTGRQRNNHMRYLLNRFVKQASTRTIRVRIDVANMPAPPPRPYRPIQIATNELEVPATRPQLAMGSATGNPQRGVVALSVSVPETFAALEQSQQATQAAPASPPGAEPPVQQAQASGSAPDTLASRIENQWLIQVGAYGQESAAADRLNQARTAAANILAHGNAYTEPVVKNEQTLYRARFRGFDRDTAKKACKALKRAKFSCLPMPLN